MNNIDFMGRGQPAYRQQQMRNFEEFPGFPPPNTGDMMFNNPQMNQVNPNNAFFVPCDMMFSQMMDFRARAPANAAFPQGRPGFPGNMPAGMMPPTANSANGMVAAPPPGVVNPGSNGVPSGMPPQHQQQSGMAQQSSMGHMVGQQDAVEDVLFVFSTHCGRIIGKGGAKIKEIQTNSGARIKIHSDEEPVNGQTRVTVSGTQEQRMLGKQMIQEVVQEGQRRYGLPGSGEDGMQSGGGWRGGDEGMMPPPQQHQMQMAFQPQHVNNNMNHQNSNNRMGTWQQQQGGGMKQNMHGGRPGGKGDYEEELSLRFSRMVESNRKTDNNEQHAIVKDFYQEDPAVKAMTLEQRDQFCRERQNIILPELLNPTSNGVSRIPNPITTFEQMFSRYPEILTMLKRQGFSQPTPIQCMAWPILTKGLDFIGIAQTGTGKTLAFLLPAMIHIEGQIKPRNQRRGPTALILSPTRELAMQIQNEADRIRYRGIRCVCLYGGADRRAQLRKLEEGADMVVATPGRLIDLIESQRISLSEVSYLVIDEADRMLDMGFEPQVVKALMEVRSDRQTVMTSATWPSGVRRIANAYTTDPLMVHVGTLDLNVCHDVTQLVEVLEEDEKQSRLMHFVTQELVPGEKALVFVSRKIDCAMLASSIQCMSGAPSATCIHGDMDQAAREDALSQMRCGDVTVLVATDLASRGLDIKDIAYVINYDFPKNIEEYVHRVGRTGRAGRTGTSITFMTRAEYRHADQLITIMEEAGQEVSPDLRSMARYNNGGQRGRGGRGNNRGNMRGGGGGGGNSGGGGGNSGGNGNFSMNGGGNRPNNGNWMPGGGGGPRQFNHGNFPNNGFYGGGGPGPSMMIPAGSNGEFGGMFDARMYGAAMYDQHW